ncbi:MAG: Hsp20/alpha crystallin family protein [Actinomycetota bacterium]
MLMRFDPFRELDRLTDDVGRRRAARPLPLDAHREDDAVVLRFDVPGVAVDDLDLSVEQDTLTLTAERPAADTGDALVRERHAGRFTRTLTLGDALDTDRLEATHADGVLVVRIPVREQVAARRVPIGTGASNAA